MKRAAALEVGVRLRNLVKAPGVNYGFPQNASGYILHPLMTRPVKGVDGHSWNVATKIPNL